MQQVKTVLNLSSICSVNIFLKALLVGNNPSNPLVDFIWCYSLSSIFWLLCSLTPPWGRALRGNVLNFTSLFVGTSPKATNIIPRNLCILVFTQQAVLGVLVVSWHRNVLGSGEMNLEHEATAGLPVKLATNKPRSWPGLKLCKNKILNSKSPLLKINITYTHPWCALCLTTDLRIISLLKKKHFTASNQVKKTQWDVTVKPSWYSWARRPE